MPTQASNLLLILPQRAFWPAATDNFDHLEKTHDGVGGKGMHPDGSEPVLSSRKLEASRRAT
jgi:hypothetical protein